MNKRSAICTVSAVVLSFAIGYYSGSRNIPDATDQHHAAQHLPSSAANIGSVVTSVPHPTSTARPTATPKPAAVQYVLNTNTKKFHKPGCSSVKQMNDKNKKVVTWSREEIIDKGYDPCGRCHP